MILLLSNSVRHKRILKQLGFEDHEFTCRDVPLAEELGPKMDRPAAITAGKDRALARVTLAAKAGPIEPRRHDESQILIVSPETIALLNDKVIRLSDRAAGGDRARLADEVRTALRVIRGQELQIVSILCLAAAEDTDRHIFLERITRIGLRSYSDEDIEAYLAYAEELAGITLPFAVDGRGAAFVDFIDGSYTSVLGLPIEELYQGLQDPLFHGRVTLPSNAKGFTRPMEQLSFPFRLIAMGDIGLELSFETQAHAYPEAIGLSETRELRGSIARRVGGDAALFASHARRAGFPRVDLLASLGDDFVRDELMRQLAVDDVSTTMLLPRPNHVTDLMLNVAAPGLPALRILDTRPAISVRDVESFVPTLKEANLLFVSGSCLLDGRREAARRALQLAYEAGVKTMVVVPAGIERRISFGQVRQDLGPYVSVLVLDASTAQEWLGSATIGAMPDNLMPQVEALIVSEDSGNLRLITARQSIRVPDLPHESDPSAKRDRSALLASLLYRLMAPRVLIASRSPWRTRLLRQVMAPNKLEVFPSNIEEIIPGPGESIQECLKMNALRKARAVRERGGYNPHVKVIIGTDTNMILDGQAIDQVRDSEGDSSEQARNMLRRLSGRTHDVVTGLAMIDARTGREVTEVVTTVVRLRRLTSEAIEAYIETEEPLGKAGGYGIQGLGATLVETLYGSYGNAFGFPLERVITLLQEEFDLPIWQLDAFNGWKLDV